MTRSSPTGISRGELDGLLERARSEGWRELTLLGPYGTPGLGARAERAFQLEQPLREDATKLADLPSLTDLNLNGNQIGDEGARAIARLTSLSSLHLAGNQIGDEGAQAIAQLTSLSTLSLAYNQIGDKGARAIARLTSLTDLNLTDNQIGDEGARAIARLTSLSSLNLSLNQIGRAGAEALLDGLLARGGSEGLQILDLTFNGDLSALVPDEVLRTFDAQAILAAYRRYRSAQQAQTLRPLNEAKLLVVGNEAVGKTSLIRYLVEERPRKEDERKTAGTAIHEQIDTQKWSPGQSPVTLNVWDFGGQEIMHGTHRFFLTRRSLYLLVLEDRREDDTSVFEWLKTVANRGGDSPVVVVINKSDAGQRNLQLDETGIRRDYPQVVAFVRTSCNDDDFSRSTIAELRALIATTLATDARLEHIRAPIPQAWQRVKDHVAERARKESVLRIGDYRGLCLGPGEGAPEGIDDEAEQRALLRLLHDLGTVVAHGLDDAAPAVLREVTLLDPNWLTQAIYTLLNSPTTRDQQGVFRRGQIAELLDRARYPLDRHEFILAMMMDIGLCFRLPDAAGSSPISTATRVLARSIRTCSPTSWTTPGASRPPTSPPRRRGARRWSGPGRSRSAISAIGCCARYSPTPKARAPLPTSTPTWTTGARTGVPSSCHSKRADSSPSSHSSSPTKAPAGPGACSAYTAEPCPRTSPSKPLSAPSPPVRKWSRTRSSSTG